MAELNSKKLMLIGLKGDGDVVLQKGAGEGSAELKPYTGTDDSEGNSKDVKATASGEGAMALGENSEAHGKRARVLGKECVAEEDAWDAVVVGQVCKASDSGTFTGGIRTENAGRYGITYGTDCKTGKNVRALNVGISNNIAENTEDDYGTRFAVGTALIVLNKKYRAALGQWNEGNGDAVFEYGNGTGSNDRKNAFDITDTNAIRQYGTKWFIKKRSGQKNGCVIIDTDVIPAGTMAVVELPTKSGKLALDEDVQSKVPATSSPYKIYATNYKGEQIAMTWGYVASGAGIIPVRDTGGHLIVPLVPTDDEHAVSKQYVDAQKLYLHKVKVVFHIDDQYSAYDAAGMHLTFDFLSTSGTSIPVGTYVSSVKGLLDQQEGRLLHGRDDIDLRHWSVAFVPAGDFDAEASITGWNYRGETFSTLLANAEPRVESDDVITL